MPRAVVGGKPYMLSQISELAAFILRSRGIVVPVILCYPYMYIIYGRSAVCGCTILCTCSIWAGDEITCTWQDETVMPSRQRIIENNILIVAILER